MLRGGGTARERQDGVAQDGIENAIEKLLASVDRPGDFCAHGRLLAPMPRLEVEGAGTLSFPVLEVEGAGTLSFPRLRSEP